VRVAGGVVLSAVVPVAGAFGGGSLAYDLRDAVGELIDVVVAALNLRSRRVRGRRCLSAGGRSPLIYFGEVSRSARTMLGPIDESASRSVSQWSATSSNVLSDFGAHVAVLHCRAAVESRYPPPPG
jgi:hypothetical protein